MSNVTMSNTRRLVTIAFFIALEVVLTRFLSINTDFLRIGFGFLPVACVGILFGPLWAGAAYAVGDVLGMLIFPSGIKKKAASGVLSFRCCWYAWGSTCLWTPSG